MDVEEKFVLISGLICEPSRAKMLWQLLDNRAYTASELAIAADISQASASNHLSKLLEVYILKVETQGRHRYYSFFGPEVAYVTEALANLANLKSQSTTNAKSLTNGVQYCRTCYDHLAGLVGVRIVEAMVQKGLLQKWEKSYLVTQEGWEWLSNFSISENDFSNKRRPLARQCLDWSERRPHLAGQLGAVLLHKMFERKWFRKVKFSRELTITPKGQKEIYELLDIVLN